MKSCPLMFGQVRESCRVDCMFRDGDKCILVSLAESMKQIAEMNKKIAETLKGILEIRRECHAMHEQGKRRKKRETKEAQGQ